VLKTKNCFHRKKLQEKSTIHICLHCFFNLYPPENVLLCKAMLGRFQLVITRAWQNVNFPGRPKTSSCQLPYQHLSSATGCARELFKDSNRSDSLLDCTWKKIFWLRVVDFLWLTS